MGARCLETVGLHQCKWHHNTVMWCDVMRYHVTHSEFDETDLREQLGCSPDHSPLAWQVRIMLCIEIQYREFIMPTKGNVALVTLYLFGW